MKPFDLRAFLGLWLLFAFISTASADERKPTNGTRSPIKVGATVPIPISVPASNEDSPPTLILNRASAEAPEPAK